MANKVRYGLEQVYYAVATQGTGGALTYATPVALPGAVNITLSAEGDSTPFYADNILYFQSTANNGYSGTLELAVVPDSFLTDVLGQTADNNSILVEKSGTPVVEFALLFQFEGDQNKTRHCMYRCTASRAEVSGATTEASITPQTETLNITVMPRINDKVVKSKCTDTQTAQYSAWYTQVYEPSF